MKAILLSAGYGTRLMPYTKSTPKCLMKINNKPLLEFWIEKLLKIGFTSILINLHYKKEKVLKSPNLPKYVFLYFAPNDSQLSSIKIIFFFWQNFLK